MKTPEQSLEELKVDLLSKYLTTSSALLDAKMLLRAYLDYPENDPSVKQMLYMLRDKMTKQNEKIAELEEKLKNKKDK